MTTLYILWLFFAAFFLYFAYLNWRQSREDIREFTIRNRDPDAQATGPAAEISQANRDFSQDFNRYLDSVNQHNRSRHRAAAIGYTVSGAISLLSMGMLLFLT
jgi:Flp pilus assembly protein TadB